MSAPLFERDAELAALQEFVDGITGSGPRLLLVEGPAGIGKSSLVGEARVLAAGDGIPVIAARGSQLEREFPFGVVRQLFEPWLATPKGAQAPARGRGRARGNRVRDRSRRGGGAMPSSPRFTASTG